MGDPDESDPQRNRYPDFEPVPRGLRKTVRQVTTKLSEQAGIKIPHDRVLVAPWVGRIRDEAGKIQSASTSQGWVRNSSRFWSEWERRFPVDAKLMGRDREGHRIVTKALAGRYGWETSGPNSVVGQKLIHHHVDNGPLVVALPEKIHRKLSGMIHAKPTVVGEPGSYRTRVGSAASVGGRLVFDLVLDLVAMKFQEWRNDKALRDALKALEPEIASKKAEALHSFICTAEFPEASDYYYNVTLRITAKSTIAALGGRGHIIPGVPRPELVGVSISSENANRLIDQKEAVRGFGGVRDGMSPVLIHSDTQLVVYSELVE